MKTERASASTAPAIPTTCPSSATSTPFAAGLNWLPTTNLTVRPEIRADWFDGEQAGQPFDDGTDDSQLLLAVDAILLF